jgi:hypothetical protein
VCECTNIKRNPPTAHRRNRPTPHVRSAKSSTLAHRCVHKYGEYFTYPLQHLKELKRQKKGESSRNNLGCMVFERRVSFPETTLGCMVFDSWCRVLGPEGAETQNKGQIQPIGWILDPLPRTRGALHSVIDAMECFEDPKP